MIVSSQANAKISTAVVAIEADPAEHDEDDDE